jgi:hypothetical protein
MLLTCRISALGDTSHPPPNALNKAARKLAAKLQTCAAK